MDKLEWKSSLRDWINNQGYSLFLSKEEPIGKAVAVGKHKNGVQHAVVILDGKFAFDPDKENNYLETISYYMVITPLDK